MLRIYLHKIYALIFLGIGFHFDIALVKITKPDKKKYVDLWQRLYQWLQTHSYLFYCEVDTIIGTLQETFVWKDVVQLHIYI
mgnify:CR=1 FL=1